LFKQQVHFRATPQIQYKTSMRTRDQSQVGNSFIPMNVHVVNL